MKQSKTGISLTPGKAKAAVPDSSTAVDSFVQAAEVRDHTYPWEEPGVRPDVERRLTVRFPEPTKLKLEYVTQKNRYSMNRFCLDAITKAIEEEFERLKKNQDG